MSRPTDDELHSMIDKAADIINDEDDSGYHGMTYEEGIRDAIEWALFGEEPPLD